MRRRYSFSLRHGLAPAGLMTLAVVLTLALATAGTAYPVTNLVSDIPGLAAHTEPNLGNPWGIPSSPTSPFWIADNKPGVATLYNGSGQPQALVATIPRPTGGIPPAANTGGVQDHVQDLALPFLPEEFEGQQGPHRLLGGDHWGPGQPRLAHDRG